MRDLVTTVDRAAELIRSGKLEETSLRFAIPSEGEGISQPSGPMPTAQHNPAEAAKDTARPPRRFTRCFFRFAGECYAYRLYVPHGPQDGEVGLRPLIVLLHGCQQDAADFAQGTGMNALAQKCQCLVLYPEQLAKANHMRCWNWYERGHQSRDAGEPAMLAALARHVLKKRQGDPTRVYIGGLSAGGAMATLTARLYPELFAAAGVHSGVPAGAARDVMSAFNVMSSGASRTAELPPGPAVPTIVFHGSDDRTVHPGNGEQVVLAAVAGLDAAGLGLVKSGALHQDQDERDTARRTHRTRYSAADGISHVEHWTVDEGAHAWFGGHPAGSFTDPQGPDASEAMLSFFLQHRNLAAASAAPAATGTSG